MQRSLCAFVCQKSEVYEGNQFSCIGSIRASAVIPGHEQLEEEQNLGFDAIMAADNMQTYMQCMDTFRTSTRSVRE